MSELIIPPHRLEAPHSPVVFLAGPVQGTHDWQREAAEQLFKHQPNLAVVSPRGPESLYRSPSSWLADGEQTPWEKYHLRLARDTGCLAMWLAAQDNATPGRAFAQTSRIEFGRIAGWMDYDPSLSFVFGINPRYEGGNRTYFEEVCKEFDIPVHDKLDEWTEAIAEELGR